MMPLVNGDRAVRWLSALPRSWKSGPLKYEIQVNGRSLPEDSHPGLEFRYIDISSVDPDGNFAPLAEMIFENAPSRARRVPQTGDTILSTVRTYLRAIAYIGESPESRICSTGFAVLTPGTRLHPRFLFYWVRSEQFVDEICGRSVGVSYPAINASEIGSLPVPLLPLEHQQSIADFLDQKTAVIDALIRKKEGLVKLLQERRQVLITQAVTKGLDSMVPRKDSGVEWLGEIPAHWSIVALKRASRRGYKTFTDGDWIEAPYIANEGVRLIQTGNIGTGEYIEKGFRFVSEETFCQLRCTEVFPSDVLICRLDGPVGRACLAPNLRVKMITSVDNAILKTGDHYDPRFLVYFMSSSTWLDWIQVLCRVGGGHRFRVSRSMLGELKITRPPLDEQRRIADSLDAETETSKLLEARIEVQVSKLREYRQALISAAVTGKIDVCAEDTA